MIQEHAETVLEKSGLENNLRNAKAKLEAVWTTGIVKRSEEWVTEANKRLRQTVFASHKTKRQEILDRFDAKRRRMSGLDVSRQDVLTTDDEPMFNGQFSTGSPSQTTNNSTHFMEEEEFHDREFLSCLECFGALQGLPHSHERSRQAQGLLGTWLWLRYGQIDKATWLKFLLEQPQNYYLAACLESNDSLSARSYSKRRWLQEATEAGTDMHRIDNFTSRREVFQRVSERLMTMQAQWLQDSHKRGQKLLKDAPVARNLDGSPVHINQDGLITIKYRYDTRIKTIQIKFGSSVIPQNYLDLRTIHFTESGIDIRNSQGTTLYANGNPKAATITRDSFSGYASGTDIKTVWGDVTGLCSSSLTFAAVGRPPKATLGRPIPSKMPSTKTTPVLSEHDALWLLDKFLYEVLPAGGDFWTGDKASYPMRPDSAVGTDDFLL